LAHDRKLVFEENLYIIDHFALITLSRRLKRITRDTKSSTHFNTKKQYFKNHNHHKFRPVDYIITQKCVQIVHFSDIRGSESPFN